MKKIILLSIFLIVVAISFYFIVGMPKSPTEVSSINYTFSINEKVQINLDTDKLNFGGGPSGSTLQRRMNISAPYDAKVRIDSIGYGMLVVNKNDFLILANQPTEVEFALNVPSDLPEGRYEGTVFVSFYD